MDEYLRVKLDELSREEVREVIKYLNKVIVGETTNNIKPIGFVSELRGAIHGVVFAGAFGFSIIKMENLPDYLEVLGSNIQDLYENESYIYCELTPNKEVKWFNRELAVERGLVILSDIKDVTDEDMEELYEKYRSFLEQGEKEVNQL